VREDTQQKKAFQIKKRSLKVTRSLADGARVARCPE